MSVWLSFPRNAQETPSNYHDLLKPRVHMAMEIFVELRKLLRSIGFLEYKTRHGRLLSLLLRLPGFSLLIFTITTTLWFLAFEAATFAEQTQSIETTEAYSYILIIYVIFISSRRDFLLMIKIFEKRIGEREYRIGKTFFKIRNKYNFQTNDVSNYVRQIW